MTTDTLEKSPAITPEIVAEHGLNDEEYSRILNALGREPNITELGIFFGHVVGALFVQELQNPSQKAADRGTASDLRAW